MLSSPEFEGFCWIGFHGEVNVIVSIEDKGCPIYSCDYPVPNSPATENKESKMATTS